jgi:hypothetical protein
MRCCPETSAETTNGSNDDSMVANISAFEDQCVLRVGVWPGSAPNGQRSRNFRWRGRNIDTGTSLWREMGQKLRSPSKEVPVGS